MRHSLFIPIDYEQLFRKDSIVAEIIRVGIVGATVTQGGSAGAPMRMSPHSRPYQTTNSKKPYGAAHEDTAKASAEKFGADLAFHDMGEMVAHPDVDLIAVVVRVPWHQDLVMAAINANKPVCCSGRLAPISRKRPKWRKPRWQPVSPASSAYRQSDPAVMYARDLVAGGEIGDIVTVNLRVMVNAIPGAGDGRIGRAFMPMAPTR